MRSVFSFLGKNIHSVLRRVVCTGRTMYGSLSLPSSLAVITPMVLGEFLYSFFIDRVVAASLGDYLGVSSL